MLTAISGKPGVQSTFFATPRDIFYGGRKGYMTIPGPVTLDGTLTSNPTNTPYIWHIWAGTLVGRVTTTGKYANSIIGLSSQALGAGGTTLTTDVATATEIVRRVGTSGTLKLAGPPTAAGTVATQTLTYSAVNPGTGAITITAASAASVTGSLIMPTDGSGSIVTLICDEWGIKIVDVTNTNRVDVFDCELYAGGGIINTGYIVNYPADASLKAWVKAQIRTNIPDAKFHDDLINT